MSDDMTSDAGSQQGEDALRETVPPQDLNHPGVTNATSLSDAVDKINLNLGVNADAAKVHFSSLEAAIESVRLNQLLVAEKATEIAMGFVMHQYGVDVMTFTLDDVAKFGETFEVRKTATNDDSYTIVVERKP